MEQSAALANQGYTPQIPDTHGMPTAVQNLLIQQGKLLTNHEISTTNSANHDLLRSVYPGVPTNIQQILLEREFNLQFGLPLEVNYITSLFGIRSDAIPRKHDGLDFRAKKGTPVKAVSGGLVKIADLEYSGSNSKSSYLIILGDNGIEQRYVHMDSFDVKVGDKVKRGQLLGKTGNRKNAQPHLHFELRKNGAKLNPLDYLPKELLDKDNENNILYKAGKNE